MLESYLINNQEKFVISMALRLQELALLQAVMQMPPGMLVHMDHRRNLHIFKYYYHLGRVEKLIGLTGVFTLIDVFVLLATRQMTPGRQSAIYYSFVLVELLLFLKKWFVLYEWQWYSNRIFLGLDHIYHQRQHQSKIQQVVDDIVLNSYLTVRTFRWRRCMFCHDRQCLFLFRWPLFQYFNGYEYIISENSRPEHTRMVEFHIYMCARCIAYKMYLLFVDVLSKATKQQTKSVRMSNIRQAVQIQKCLRKKCSKDNAEQIMRFLSFARRYRSHLSKHGTLQGTVFCYDFQPHEMLHIMDRVYEYRK